TISQPLIVGLMTQALCLEPRARVLEIGTLGGYSTIWMARELPEDGELLTLEADPRHAAVARENLRLAGVDKQVTLREGPALQTLESLGDRPPFDLIFI
ncbi:class I SAM-dependent methyltransferase, partial [Klebsiella pneumoniae]|nr:class I SAM-dependent methyltransferase [Klebsiella pneumoniae]